MTVAYVKRSYFFIVGIYTLSASLIWAVNTLFLIQSGLDIFEVFIANSIFTASMAFFEIPTGVLADTKGRRASFLLSVIIILIGTIGYVWTGNVRGGLGFFALFSVVLGLGYTFYSGAVEAWLVDALNHVGFKENLDSVFAQGSMITAAAMLIGTVGGGALGNIDLSIPFILRAILLFIVFIIALFVMKDWGFTPEKISFKALPKKMLGIAKSSVKFGWKERSVRFLILSSFVQMFFFVWAWYAWPPYFLELLEQPEAVWIIGLISALVSASTILGNSLISFFSRFCTKRTTLMIWASLFQTLMYLVIGLVSFIDLGPTRFYIAALAFLLSSAASGVISPVKQAYIHQLIPSEQRATVISFESLLGSGSSVIGQSSLGYLSRERGFGLSYISGGALTILTLPILMVLKARKDDEDIIRGKAGKKPSCPAQGLPKESSIDTDTFVE